MKTVIEMAREANIKQAIETPHLLMVHELERFADLVAAAEREACAELALQGTDEPVQTKTLEILRKERERIADAIRARGNK